jgi:hypothetical protein
MMMALAGQSGGAPDPIASQSGIDTRKTSDLTLVTSVVVRDSNRAVLEPGDRVDIFQKLRRDLR